MKRPISVLNIRENHTPYDQPVKIEMNVCLDYLRGKPVETIEISRPQAIRLLEQLSKALRIASESNT